MAIPEEQLAVVRKALDESARPVFLYDDDPDGLSSFLLLYRYKGDGRGIIIKTSPELTDGYVKPVEDAGADLVVILDKALVSQDFLDKIHVPIYWIDHHTPVDRKKVHYFNPRIADDKDNRPTTYWAWQIVKEARPQDMWIAAAGIVSDWFIPDFRKEFNEQYHGYLPEKIKRPEEALFDSKIGVIARIFSMNLKGQTKDALTSAKILTRIKHPREILEQTSPQGKFIHKRYMQYEREYQKILAGIKPERSKILLFKYDVGSTSLTANLSNELLYKYPKKIIIIARHNNAEYKCSLRADARYSKPIDKAVAKALENIRGHGGGHLYACGAGIHEDDFQKFLDQFAKALKHIQH
jgi:single-stranded DNA-specific DHH superfamily exonuclease